MRVVDAESRLSLRDAARRQLASQDQHRDSIEVGSLRPDDGAVAPEADVGDSALGNPAGLVDQQAIVKTGSLSELMKSALSPAAHVLEPGKRALEMLNRHGVRAAETF